MRRPMAIIVPVYTEPENVPTKGMEDSSPDKPSAENDIGDEDCPLHAPRAAQRCQEGVEV